MGAKRVGIVGAGVAGLAAIKHSLDEGMVPICWEQADNIGGLWNYNEEVKEGFPSLYNSCVINTCKEMTCYSDFPIPKEFPNFMSHRYFKKYIDMYSDEFALRKHISFGQSVQKIEKAPDFDATGQWTVSTRNLNTGTIDSHVVDAVLVCNGHLHEPNMPKLKGLDSFKGKVLHSRDFKTFHGFENKRVLVVGMGNSGSDAACEISRHAEHVYVSTRRGAYVIQRAGEYGQPFDQGCIRRWLQILPHSLMRPIHYHKVNYKYKHANYSLSPNFRFDAGVATISDDLPNRILVGAISIRTDVSHFKEHSAVLEDGTTLEDIDIVVLATGYHFSFPFLDDSVIKIDGHYPRLYNLVFPVDLEPCTLAVVGLVQPFGALPPTLEMQARVATRVLAGKCQLPSKQEMTNIVDNRNAFLKSKYVDSPRYSLQVYLINYLDTLAQMIGCRPNLWRLFFSDPKMWYQVYFGPATPPQWRLEGPGKWDGARKAIASVQEKTYYPMKTRVSGQGERDGLYDGWIQVLKCVVILFVISVLYRTYLSMH